MLLSISKLSLCQLKWLENQLVEFNVDLELGMIEALLDIVAALGMEMDVTKSEKVALETQTEEQFTAAYAQEQEERTQCNADRELRQEEQFTSTYAEKQE
jgi:hypothetical protein